ncbi:MAG TPA: PA14 domain-containing protein [Lacipirellulaceae bacterium]
MAQRHLKFHRPLRPGFEVLEHRLALAGTGLTAQYFHNDDFTGLAETRVEAVSHNWGTGSPAAGIDAESFSVRWTGQIQAKYSQSQTFRVFSDEGVRVWVDGQLIIDDWTPHVRRQQTGTINLVAGRFYDIRVDYFERTGDARMELSWLAPSQAVEPVSADQLYESPAGLLGSYTDSTGGALTRVDAGVDFDWGPGSPDSAIDSDGFQVTWAGQIRADFNALYTFATTSNDGVRLWIGNELVIDNWSSQSGAEATGAKVLEAGKWTDVRLEYYENVGVANVEFRWSSARQTGAGVFEVVPQESLRAIKHMPVTFKNPLGTGADPFVIQWQDKYYMSRSAGGAVWINRAESLQDIHASSLGSDTVLAWDPPSGTNFSAEIWAPELHRIGESWYIYVAASNGNNETHRMHVLERNAPDPFGSYVYKGQIVAPTDRWAIDGTVFEWEGFTYFVWSGWPGFSDGQQNLYIAQMQNPWTLRTDRVLISSPQYAWEMHGLAINEGPQILIENGKLHIIYSASGFWTPQYALGRLTYNGTGSLLNAASWTKARQPVFQSANNVVGVGHASFVKSPDGSEDWIVYHAHKDPVPPSGEMRDVRIQPFTFLADGTPAFGAPIPTHLAIRAPSVGPDPERLFVAGDYNADGLVDAADHATWRATYDLLVFPGSGADGNANGVVDTADYIIWRRNRSDAALQSASMSGAQAPPQRSPELVESPSSVSEWATSRPQHKAGRRPALVSAAVDAALQGWRAEDERATHQRALLRDANHFPSTLRAKHKKYKVDFDADDCLAEGSRDEAEFGNTNLLESMIEGFLEKQSSTLENKSRVNRIWSLTD